MFYSMQKLIFLSVILIKLNFLLADNILGIDLGSEYIKAAILRPNKPFTMVENIQSKTATSVGVGFKPDERLFGPDTLVYKARFPKQVVNYMDRYLVEKYGSEKIEKYIKDHFVSYDITENKDRETIDFHVKFKNENHIFSTEELYGMLFRYIKFITEKFTDQRITEAYISVPSSWGYKKRHGIYQSAKLAGLQLKGLPTHNTAAAVQFYTDKNFDEQKYFIFYTMGATYTQASLVSYKNVAVPDPKNKNSTIETKEINILAETYDDHLGGRDFDFVLVKTLMNKFDNTEQKKGKPSCSLDYKVPDRILPSAIKYKEILSSNKQVGINILGVENGMNLVSTLTKEDFEDSCKDLLSKVYAPIEKLFEMTGLNIEQIEQVELLGGGVRIPKIQEILKEKLGESKIGTHMNGDDSFAFGTSYIFANSTKHFKVKKRLVVNNGLPFEIKVETSPLNEKSLQVCPETLDTIIDKEDECVRNINKTTTLYRVRHGFDIARTVSFKHDSDFMIKIKEIKEATKEETDLMTYTVTGFAEAREELRNANLTTIPKINLRFKLSDAGLLSLTGDILYESNLYFTRSFNENTNSTEYKYLSEITEPLSEEKLLEELEVLKAAGKNETDKEYTKIKNIGRIKKQENKINLKVQREFTNPRPLNKEEFNAAKKVLDNLDNIENERLKNIEAKNTLETEIYARKDWIDTDKAKLYSKPEELEKIESTIKEIHEWYDEEGYNADTETLKKKYTELTTNIVPVENRRTKHEKRIKAQDDLEKEMFRLKNEGIKLLENKPWLHNHYHTVFHIEYTRIEQWIDEKKIEHAKLTLTEDPIISSDTYDLKLRQIKREYQMMSLLPKPKEEKVTNTTEANFTETNSTESNQNESKQEETVEEKSNSRDGDL